jgi:hypothetical protein
VQPVPEQPGLPAGAGPRRTAGWLCGGRCVWRLYALLASLHPPYVVTFTDTFTEVQYTKVNARIMTNESSNMNADAARAQSRWTFLTNHLLVLACLTRDPELRIRDIADLIGITERATVQILSQLEAAGYLTKVRVGRRNQYTIHGELPLRHPIHQGRQVGEVLRAIEPEPL